MMELNYITSVERIEVKNQSGDHVAQGIIYITFPETTTDADIQKTVSDFYSTNSDKIGGMTYLEFRAKDTLDKVKKFVKELDQS